MNERIKICVLALGLALLAACSDGPSDGHLVDTAGHCSGDPKCNPEIPPRLGGQALTAQQYAHICGIAPFHNQSGVMACASYTSTNEGQTLAFKAYDPNDPTQRFALVNDGCQGQLFCSRQAVLSVSSTGVLNPIGLINGQIVVTHQAAFRTQWTLGWNGVWGNSSSVPNTCTNGWAADPLGTDTIVAGACSISNIGVNAWKVIGTQAALVDPDGPGQGSGGTPYLVYRFPNNPTVTTGEITVNDNCQHVAGPCAWKPPVAVLGFTAELVTGYSPTQSQWWVAANTAVCTGCTNTTLLFSNSAAPHALTWQGLPPPGQETVGNFNVGRDVSTGAIGVVNGFTSPFNLGYSFQNGDVEHLSTGHFFFVYGATNP